MAKVIGALTGLAKSQPRVRVWFDSLTRPETGVPKDHPDSHTSRRNLQAEYGVKEKKLGTGGVGYRSSFSGNPQSLAKFAINHLGVSENVAPHITGLPETMVKFDLNNAINDLGTDVVGQEVIKELSQGGTLKLSEVEELAEILAMSGDEKTKEIGNFAVEYIDQLTRISKQRAPDYHYATGERNVPSTVDKAINDRLLDLNMDDTVVISEKIHGSPLEGKIVGSFDEGRGLTIQSNNDPDMVFNVDKDFVMKITDNPELNMKIEQAKRKANPAFFTDETDF